MRGVYPYSEDDLRDTILTVVGTSSMRFIVERVSATGRFRVTNIYSGASEVVTISKLNDWLCGGALEIVRNQEAQLWASAYKEARRASRTLLAPTGAPAAAA